jgi:biopolymer transport protein ExbB/TolQ
MEYYVDVLTIGALISIVVFSLTAWLINIFGSSSLYIAKRRLKEAHDKLTYKDNYISGLENEIKSLKNNHYGSIEEEKRIGQGGAYSEEH